MSKELSWERIVRRLELLRGSSPFPVAFKMLQKKEELDRIPFIEGPTEKRPFVS